MSAQSSFLDCFLKFLKGEEGEKLPSSSRSSGSRFKISASERNAILLASSKKLNAGQKALQLEAMKEKQKIRRPRSVNVKQKPREQRRRGSSTSEVEGNPGAKAESKLGDKERLRGEDEQADGGTCVSSEPERVTIGHEKEEGKEVSIKSEVQDMDEVAEDVCKDTRKANGETGESDKKNVCSSNVVETEAGKKVSSVIFNGDSKNSEVQGDESSSANCPAVKEKKKRGRKRKNESEGGVPRRRLSSRKAKQKVMISYAESDEEDIPGLDDNSDSDDPVWVPDEKKGSSDEGSNFSWSRYEKLHLKSRKSSSNPPEMSPSKAREERKEVTVDKKEVKSCVTEDKAKEDTTGDVGSRSNLKRTGSEENGGSCSKPTSPMRLVDSSGNLKGRDNARTTIVTSNATTKVQPVDRSDLFHSTKIVMPFQSGTFIAQKSDLEEREEPPIWRVDGKSLLQKYEPFRSTSGNIWYRNVSTYSGWGPKSHLKYQEVPVKFIKQNRVETIVEIIQAELTINEDKLLEKLMKESEKHAYAYEVFVQTLVSQALDASFLNEIIAENDEYFLNCMEEMDKVCSEKQEKLMKACNWPKNLTESLTTWPVMILTPNEDALFKHLCSVCFMFQTKQTNVKLDGNSYKYSTLEYYPPSEKSFKCKEFTVCKSCCDALSLFHKISHLKYHTYEEGSRMVLEKKESDPSKSNTDVLHDILADGPSIKKCKNENLQTCIVKILELSLNFTQCLQVDVLPPKITVQETKKFEELSLMWAQADVKSRKMTAEEKKIIDVK